jgi:uncharacterized membrane protein YGL010W
MAFLDLEQHLVFVHPPPPFPGSTTNRQTNKQNSQYGTYHTHRKNVLIHIIFVPILMFTIMALLSNIPLSSSSSSPSPYLNLSTLVASTYALLYILMEPFAGSLLAPYVILQSLLGSYCARAWGAAGFNYWAAAVQVVAWIAQFIGHGVYERKAPALLDNLVQALFLAPLFVWLECLFMIGYRPELKARMDAKVKAAREKLDMKDKAAKEAKVQ